MPSGKSDSVNIVKIDYLQWVTVANGQQVEVQGRDNARLNFDNGKTVSLTDVMYVPTLHGKILPVSALTSRGIMIQFDQDRVTISEKKLAVAVNTKIRRSFAWQVSGSVMETSSSAMIGSSADSIN